MPQHRILAVGAFRVNRKIQHLRQWFQRDYLCLKNTIERQRQAQSMGIIIVQARAGRLNRLHKGFVMPRKSEHRCTVFHALMMQFEHGLRHIVSVNIHGFDEFKFVGVARKKLAFEHAFIPFLAGNRIISNPRSDRALYVPVVDAQRIACGHGRSLEGANSNIEPRTVGVGRSALRYQSKRTAIRAPCVWFNALNDF